jgi:single-stranded-DNA-specific exonuclease
MRQTLTDGCLDGRCLSLEFAMLLREAGPWGQHFPEPVFDGTFAVLSARVLGGKHLKLVLQVPQSDRIVDAIAFNQAPEILADAEQGRDGVRVLYKLDINEYRGASSPQLLIERLEFAETVN